jgi:hypothetical protein
LEILDKEETTITADYELGVLNKQGNSAYSNVSLRGIGDSPSTLRGGSPTDQFGLDKINSLPIYRSEAVSTDDIVNDFVKFRIAVIDNDNPRFKTFMHFRAFLGPISDSYNANWNGFNYLGRGEQFYTYGGFTRTNFIIMDSSCSIKAGTYSNV